MNEQSPGPAAPRRLTRSSDDRMIAGVCGGVAAYTGLDPTILRLAAAFLVLFGGTGLLAYLVAWAIMPAADGRPAVVEKLRGES